MRNAAELDTQAANLTFGLDIFAGEQTRNPMAEDNISNSVAHRNLPSSNTFYLDEAHEKIMRRIVLVHSDLIPGTSCWVWQGSLCNNGYGQVAVRRAFGRSTKRMTHRLTFEFRNGSIPYGLVLDHLCRNRGCCNPDHLEAVTNIENIRRGFNARHNLNGIFGEKTHCPKGHELIGDNVVHDGNRRRCRSCKNAYAREKYAPLATHGKRGWPLGKKRGRQ
jgi:hypothetical protein